MFNYSYRESRICWEDKDNQLITGNKYKVSNEVDEYGKVTAFAGRNWIWLPSSYFKDTKYNIIGETIWQSIQTM